MPRPVETSRPGFAGTAVASLATAILVLLVALGGLGFVIYEHTQPQPAATISHQTPGTADASAGWGPWLTAAEYLAVISLLLAVPGLLVLGGLILYRRKTVWMPTPDGRLPLRQLNDGVASSALLALHQTRLEEARKQPTPHTVTLHQANTYSAEEKAPPVVEPVPIEPPSLRQMVDRGDVGGGQFVFGATVSDPAQLVRGTWDDMLSTGIGGLTGSGKTWTAVSLIAQAGINGARIAVADPHYGNEESLGSRLNGAGEMLLAPVAKDSEAILALVQTVYDELERRIALGEGVFRQARDSGDATAAPILIVLDEWLALCRRKEFKGVMERLLPGITQEGRKYGVNCLLLAQRWDVKSAGGGLLRNTLSSYIVHRSRPEDVRMLTGLGSDSFPRDTMTLAPGECFIVPTSGDISHIYALRMSRDDVAAAARRLEQPFTSRPEADALPSGYPVGGLRISSAPSTSPSTTFGLETVAPAVQQSILTMFAGGSSIADIARTVWGEKPSGRRYQRITATVQNIIRGNLQQSTATGVEEELPQLSIVEEP